MESKDKTKIKLGLIGVAAAVILAGIVVGAVFVRKYSPSKSIWMGMNILMLIIHRIVLLL